MTENSTNSAPISATNNAPTSGDNRPVYSVSELSLSLKRSVEEQFGHVRVKGEISGLKRAGSGHVYLALKDEDALLDGVMWKGTAQKLSLVPEDGMEVIATGRLTTYPGRSKYQIVIESLEIAGQGALLKLLEDRRKKLLAEGLFELTRKRALPFLPEVIGVVTSPTGAVIRDILHRLRDRFPRHVLVWPVLVQGEGAAAQVAAAIDGFNKIVPGGPVPRPDLLIVARGGGSLEDLWAFNEEIVVRAAAGSAIPLISAVGHETDTTLIDFASDRRAPTPTAAAEMAVPVRSELLLRISESGGRVYRCMTRLFDGLLKDVRNLARGLIEPQRYIEEAAQKVDDRAERATRAMNVLLNTRAAELAKIKLITPQHLIEMKKNKFETAARDASRAIKALLANKDKELKQTVRVLGSLSYQRVLDRGFALVANAEGQAILDAAAVSPGMALDIRFRDGNVAATATGDAAEPAKPKRTAAKKETPAKAKQGTLL
jgi:exodeoxyribonuclease VII large subunit